ncbi:MAG: Re/Si-specific NAD(P)(+) transhydrogenase subunit alpha [Balneolaceae bacterium]
MIAGICREAADGEQRVAISPEGVQALIELGFDVLVEEGAGTHSSFTDAMYRDAGATLTGSRADVYASCDLLLGVQAPPMEELGNLKRESILLSFIWPLQNKPYVEALQKHQITGLAVDTLPRISRAQSMDALSTMSNIAGYKAALLGANHLDRYLPMMMTAAGTIPPAKVLVLGAGVAGLQAIATARRLGAVVEAFDIRPAVKEQVESLGASFVDVPLEEETETKSGYAKELSERNKELQRETIHNHIIKSDIVITTALIPGRPAPILVTRTSVEQMHPGSVIVDLAAEQGGNCEATEPGKTVTVNGVKILGPLDIPSQLAYHASKLYSKNLLSLLTLLMEDGKPNFNFDDEIIANTTITHRGDIISPFVLEHYASNPTT